jgi:hypothetical protein
MNGLFRYQRLLLVLTIVLLSTDLLPAQMPDAAPTVPLYVDGLAFSLPPRWRLSVSEMASTNTESTSPSSDLTPLKMLALARPEEPYRTACLTILRDASRAGNAGSQVLEEAQARLNEIALVKGYRVDKSRIRGKADSPNHILLVEIEASSVDGRQRVFNCLLVHRTPQASLRCYWEYDQSDALARLEFETWLAASMLDGSKIADVLSGTTEVAKNTVPDGRLPLPGSITAPAELVHLQPVPSGAAGDAVIKNRTNLIVVQGDKGVGSGFVTSLAGEPWLLTNAHVLGDNPHPRFTSLGGATITPGAAFLAVEHDICKIKMPAGTPSIEGMTEVEANAKIGDAIVVIGNAEGAGVVHPFEGHIVGIGPTLVEVDAPFVSGNSGSPIIHLATGKVIGIATYLVTRSVNTKGQGAVETQVRRFGYRIDTVKVWEPVNWTLFYNQSAQLAKIEATGKDFERLFANARAKKLFSTSYDNPSIQRALDNFNKRAYSSGKISEADLTFARRELLSNLRTASQTDVRGFDSRMAYDYFRREVANAVKFRDEIYAGFTKSLNATSP